MNVNREEFAGPEDLPQGVHHGSLRAYNAYGCRCRYCVQYRRLWDSRERYRTSQGRRDGAGEYLHDKGVWLLGPGPFSRNPARLARMIADYLGDDLKF